MSGSVAPLEIRALDPASPDARRFLEWSDAYLASLYPAESNHLLDVETLRGPARVADGVVEVQSDE